MWLLSRQSKQQAASSKGKGVEENAKKEDSSHSKSGQMEVRNCFPYSLLHVFSAQPPIILVGIEVGPHSPRGHISPAVQVHHLGLIGDKITI